MVAAGPRMSPWASRASGAENLDQALGLGERLLIVTAAAVPAGWAAARAVARFAPQFRGPTGATMIAATLLVFGWAGVVVPPAGILAVSLALGWALVCLAVIDLISMRLPDLFTLTLVGVGLAVTFALPGAPILDHLAGAAAGYGALAVLAWAYRRWRGVDGVGLGDAKLLAAAGAWLGWRSLPSVLLIACLAAFVWVAVRFAVGDRGALRARLAFGAPLCLAIWIVWLHGPLVL